jgi:hypothetical protein
MYRMMGVKKDERKKREVITSILKEMSMERHPTWNLVPPPKLAQ